jgi:hypothetical protein
MCTGIKYQIHNQRGRGRGSGDSPQKHRGGAIALIYSSTRNTSTAQGSEELPPRHSGWPTTIHPSYSKIGVYSSIKWPLYPNQLFSSTTMEQVYSLRGHGFATVEAVHATPWLTEDFTRPRHLEQQHSSTTAFLSSFVKMASFRSSDLLSAAPRAVTRLELVWLGNPWYRRTHPLPRGARVQTWPRRRFSACRASNMTRDKWPWGGRRLVEFFVFRYLDF